MPPIDYIGELHSTLERARELLKIVELRAPGAPADLECRLSEAEIDRQRLSTQLVEVEQQRERLMALYVATFQLHTSLKPAEVETAIAEITVNLLGAEKFVLLLRREGPCEVVFLEGFTANEPSPYANGEYAGGDPAVDATLHDGVMRLGSLQGSNALAVVPLTVHGATVGALVLYKLLSHKPSLRPEDRELLDLLAAHAASALFSARLFAITNRKLRTLEEMIRFVRKAQSSA